MFADNAAVMISELIEKQCQMAKKIRKQREYRGKEGEKKVKEEREEKIRLLLMYQSFFIEHIYGCGKDLG